VPRSHRLISNRFVESGASRTYNQARLRKTVGESGRLSAGSVQIQRGDAGTDIPVDDRRLTMTVVETDVPQILQKFVEPSTARECVLGHGTQGYHCEHLSVDDRQSRLVTVTSRRHGHDLAAVSEAGR
jgi:hypothetical protein